MEARSTTVGAVTVSLSFGAALKQYRRAAGLTQEALAERAGYSVGHISKLESSARQPAPTTVELLADALELAPLERIALGRAARRIDSAPRALHGAQRRSSPRLIGRTQHEASIARHLRDTEVESPLLLFAGTPGIGKTRLLEAASEHGVQQGWLVLEGTARRNGAQGPYAPLLEALTSAIHTFDPASLHSALAGCSWLVRLLPELVDLTDAPMPAWSLPDDQERRLMFSAVERFLGNIAGPAGTLLLLDNLQWARRDALDLLSVLVHAAERSPVRIIGAYRDNGVRPEDPLASLLADLAQDRLVAHEVVGPLVPSAAKELLAELLVGAEHVEQRTRAEVLRRSSGVPFVLVSYAQWLRSRATQGGGYDSTELEVPWDVTQTTLRRVARLPYPAQEIVRIVALSDGQATRAYLVGVAQRLGYRETEALAAMDAACEAGLLVTRDDTYAFLVDLTRDVVEQNLGSAQRAHLHREIAATLETQLVVPDVERIADHLEQAGDLEKALIFIKRAAAHASALCAFADSERYYRALVERMQGPEPTRDAAEAHEQLGITLRLLGRFDDALEELERAENGYRTTGSRDDQARAAAEIGQVSCAKGDVGQAIDRLEHALTDAVGASDGSRAALYLALARLCHAGGLYERALDAADRAARLAHTDDARRVLAQAEMERGMALTLSDHPGDGVRVLEEIAAPLSEATGDLWTQAHALDQAATGHLRRGEFHEADVDIRRGMMIGLRLDDPLVSAMLTLNRGILGFYTGRWRRARADLRWASAMLSPYRSSSTRAAHAAIWLGRLALAQGRWERAEYTLRRGIVWAETTNDSQAAVNAQCALAERDLVAGRPDDARMRLEPLISASRNRATDTTEMLTLLGWAHLELGDDQQSETLVAASVVRASATGEQCALTDAQRIRALAAACAGRWQDALAIGSEALSLAQSLAYPYAEAKALWLCGRLLIHQGEDEPGRRQLAASRALLSQLGERMYAESVDQPFPVVAHRVLSDGG